VTDAPPIVLGYRADGGGRAAMRVGTEIAVAFGAPLVIMFAFDVPDAADTPELRDQVDALQAEATTAIRAQVARAAPDLVVDVALVDADPVVALRGIVSERSPRMVVIGHTDRGDAADPTTSVTYQLVHHSTVPVVVVPADDPV
jgi:nucleotide-binding universal stress UspA family protein